MKISGGIMAIAILVAFVAGLSVGAFAPTSQYERACVGLTAETRAYGWQISDGWTDERRQRCQERIAAHFREMEKFRP